LEERKKSRLDPAATSPMTTKPDGAMEIRRANGGPIILALATGKTDSLYLI
jgi:hypothetical protein